jgi:hypothetical protein
VVPAIIQSGLTLVHVMRAGDGIATVMAELGAL